MLLNKMELKRQKDMLVLYNKSLPSLKKKQNLLQKQIILFETEIAKFIREIEETENSSKHWLGVFAQEVPLPVIKISNYKHTTVNIAGIDIFRIEDIRFTSEYDMETTPWWFDDGVTLLTKVYELNIRINNLKKNIGLIKEELDSTAQRINLFEKRLIPQAEENIRKLKIFLGDQQVAAVCRGKLTKKRKEKKGEEA